MNRVVTTIAIDGPAGAGKSTVARAVAEELGYLYLDTGAMYRALTLKVLEAGALEDEEQLTGLLPLTHIQLASTADGGYQVLLNGRDVTGQIRTPRINASVSLVARLPAVREFMARQQRQMAANHNVVVDGRDIGTYVLPAADFKFFLTADFQERVNRRYQELVEQGHQTSRAEVAAEMSRRDQLDSQREVAPLRQAEDAVVIDTTSWSAERVAEEIIRRVKQATLSSGTGEDGRGSLLQDG